MNECWLSFLQTVLDTDTVTLDD